MEYGRDGLTGTAPVGVEVDDVICGGGDELLEVSCRGRGDGFVGHGGFYLLGGRLMQRRTERAARLFAGAGVRWARGWMWRAARAVGRLVDVNSLRRARRGAEVRPCADWLFVWGRSREQHTLGHNNPS